MSWAKKVDGNQKDIMEALGKWGCSVRSIAAAGRGTPDLAVGYRRMNFLLEVKMPGEKLTPLELKFSQEWLGQYAVVHTEEEALRAVGILR